MYRFWCTGPTGGVETLAFVLEEESDARRFSSRPKGAPKTHPGGVTALGNGLAWARLEGLWERKIG